MSVTYKTIADLRTAIREMDADCDDTACLSRAADIMISSVPAEHQKVILRRMTEDIVQEIVERHGTEETHYSLLKDTSVCDTIIDSMCADVLDSVPTCNLIQAFFHGSLCLDTAEKLATQKPTPTISRMDKDIVPKSDYVWARRESIEHMLKDILDLVHNAHHTADEYCFGRVETQVVDQAFEDLANKILELNGGKHPTAPEAEEGFKP